MSELNINPKKFPIGSVVYFVKRLGNNLCISFGIVIEHYADTICIQLYEAFDTRLINGIPIKDFKTPTRWFKLPKGWSYDTKLFNLSNSKLKYDVKNYNIKNPEDIMKAISDGILVKVQENDNCKIEAEINKLNGWRIIRNYFGVSYKPDYTTIRFNEVYGSYGEAEKVVEDYHAELNRQAALSDTEWSIEQIDHTLDIWKGIYSKTEEEKQKYRDWILKLENIEDIEVRIISGYIQWKKWNNSRWNNIEL